MTSTSELTTTEISPAPTQAVSSEAQAGSSETHGVNASEPSSAEPSVAEPSAAESNAAERKKAKSRAANRAAVELLCETYPQTFSFAQPRPLKIGIQEDLVTDGKLSQTKIKRGLASYVRAFGYLKSQTDAAPRINLLGEPEGAVKPDEAAHALTKLPAPRKPRPSAKKRPAQAQSKPKQNMQAKSPKPEAKIEKAPSPFDGLNEGQRMASKLDLLLNKNK